jgi:hypothetical protein
MTAIDEAAAIVRGAEDDLELFGRDAVLRRHLHVRRVGPRVRERPHPGQRSTAQPRDGNRRPSRNWNSCGVVTTGTLNPSTRLTLYPAIPPGRPRSPASPSPVAHRIIMADAPSSSEQPVRARRHAARSRAAARERQRRQARAVTVSRRPTGMDESPALAVMTWHTGNEHRFILQRQVRHRRRRCRFAARATTKAIIATTIPACCFLRNQTWFSWLVCSVFLMIFIVVEYW